MKVRYTNKPEITGFTDSFNTHGLGEVIVYFPDGDASSDEIKDLDVLLEKPLPSSVYKPGAWVPLSAALKSDDVITDNYNVRLFEPASEADKIQGWAH